MNLRTVFVAGVLALSASALRAEEFQFTIRGVASCADPFASQCTSQAITGPTIATFDVNSLTGTITPTFGRPFSGVGPNVVTNLSASFSATNYLAIVDGHTIGFAAVSGGGFGCLGQLPGPGLMECNEGFGPNFQFLDTEIWIHDLTEPQYKALKDPLTSILSMSPGSGCGFVCKLDEGPGGIVNFQGTFTVTPVPAPGPLPLFVAGLLGLVLSRPPRRERLGRPLLLRS